MNQEKLNKIIEAMSEITYHDWIKLEMVVDEKFNIQKRELEKTLQLSNDSPTIEELIRSQFGRI